jgi:hypothetical protein
MHAKVIVRSGIYNNILASINTGNKLVETKNWTSEPVIDKYRIEPCRNFPYIRIIDTTGRYKFIPDLSKSLVHIVLSTILPNDDIVDHEYTISINGVIGTYTAFIGDTNNMLVKINNDHKMTVLIADGYLDYDKVIQVIDEVGITGVVALKSYIKVKYTVKLNI